MVGGDEMVWVFDFYEALLLLLAWIALGKACLSDPIVEGAEGDGLATAEGSLAKPAALPAGDHLLGDLECPARLGDGVF